MYPCFTRPRTAAVQRSGGPSCWWVVTGTGEHGPEGKRCAICTLRSLRPIQRWSVADRLVVPLPPTPLFFCMVPGSADFVVSAYGSADIPSRRRHIPLFLIQGATLWCSKGRRILDSNSDVSFVLFQKIVKIATFGVSHSWLWLKDINLKTTQ